MYTMFHELDLELYYLLNAIVIIIFVSWKLKKYSNFDLPWCFLNINSTTPTGGVSFNKSIFECFQNNCSSFFNFPFSAIKVVA